MKINLRFITYFLVMNALLSAASKKGYGQSDPYKYDSAIIVKGVSYKSVVNTLLDSGYEIDKEKSDRDLGTAQTTYQNLKRITAAMRNLKEGQERKWLVTGENLFLADMLYAIRARVKDDSTAEFQMLIFYNSTLGMDKSEKKLLPDIQSEMFREVADLATSVSREVKYIKL